MLTSGQIPLLFWFWTDCVTWVFYLWRHQNAAAWAPATVFLLPLYKTHCGTRSFLPSGGKKWRGVVLKKVMAFRGMVINFIKVFMSCLSQDQV